MVADSLVRFREHFPVTRKRTYFFSGGATPAADPVREAVNSWIGAWAANPQKTYDELLPLMTRLRATCADLIGAPRGTIALTQNTSHASNIAVRGLIGWPGTNIVADRGTYSSSLYPWTTMTDKTVQVVRWEPAETATAEVIDRIGPDTAVVTVSHVDTRTGLRHDIRALAAAVHAVGGVLIVDAAQSAGVLPIDVEADGIDILVGTTRKWLLGLPGVGFLYARSGLLRDPEEIGHLSLDPASLFLEPELPPLWPDARRFELGAPSQPGIVAAQAGIDLVMDTGIATIASHVSKVCTKLIEACLELGLGVRTPRIPTSRAAIVAICHSESNSLTAFLHEQGIDVGFYHPDLVRVDVHGFNTEDEIEFLIQTLEAFPRREPRWRSQG